MRATVLLSGLALFVACAAPAFSQQSETTPKSQGNETLSDKLSRQKGVIPPKKSEDPEMVKKPRPTGPNETPVVPPPGIRGGPQAK